MLRKLKYTLLPSGTKKRRIPLGLGRGAVANVDFEFDTSFFFGFHEPVLHDHYKRLLKPGMKSFDVGCYRGWDALCISHMTGGDVLSFDGNASQIEVAKTFLAPSEAAGRITIVNAYVSDTTGEGRTTLDTMAEQHFVPDFIKMDIEGNEATALRGAEHILNKKKPPLIIEVHGEDVESDCIDFLREHGYFVLIVDRKRGPLEEARGMIHNRWIVCTAEPEG